MNTEYIVNIYTFFAFERFFKLEMDDCSQVHFGVDFYVHVFAFILFVWYTHLRSAQARIDVIYWL